jgi:hypothetical protein
MLLVELELAYAYMGCCIDEYSRFEAGETGVLGIVLASPGERSDRAGRELPCAAEMLKESLGLAPRAAYILMS